MVVMLKTRELVIRKNKKQNWRMKIIFRLVCQKAAESVESRFYKMKASTLFKNTTAEVAKLHIPHSISSTQATSASASTHSHT